MVAVVELVLMMVAMAMVLRQVVVNAVMGVVDCPPVIWQHRAPFSTL